MYQHLSLTNYSFASVVHCETWRLTKLYRIFQLSSLLIKNGIWFKRWNNRSILSFSRDISRLQAFWQRMINSHSPGAVLSSVRPCTEETTCTCSRFIGREKCTFTCFLRKQMRRLVRYQNQTALFRLIMQVVILSTVTCRAVDTLL